MGPRSTTVLGVLAGFVLFLAAAITSVIAVDGANDPGPTPAYASAGAGSTGEAHPGEAHPVDAKAPSVRSLDLNGDGGVSLAEAAGHPDILSRFDRADRNRDGKLTPGEFDRLDRIRPPKPVSRDAIKRSVRRDAATVSKGG